MKSLIFADKYMKKFFIFLVVSCILCACDNAEVSKENTKKSDDIFQKSADASREFFNDVKKGANDVSEEISNIPVKKKFKETSDAISEGAGEVGDKLKKVGGEVGDFFKKWTKKISD